jgi:hypothetical protein
MSTRIVSGQSFEAFSTTSRTAALFSMMLVPIRLTTSSAIAGLPLTRV